jgi:hypothetical protein
MALNVAVLAAVPTAVSGAADWADAGDEPRRLGFVHALLNVGALVIYLLSIRARGAGHRALGVALSATGFTLASLSAWVGGELVYGRGTNVNRNAWQLAVPECATGAFARAQPLRLLRCLKLGSATDRSRYGTRARPS